MDETDTLMDDFMNFDRPKRKYEAPKPTIEPQIKKIKTEEIICHKRETKSTEYSSRHSKKEENKLLAESLNMPSTSELNIEGPDEEKKESEIKEEPQQLPELQVFQRYQFKLNPQLLPILEKRKEILSNIRDNMVTVLTASTGTGKSSQVPQYILEEAREKNENCNIIVTQPRRIAAISIAKRVALERRCECGSLVGYQVGMEKKVDTQTNSDTRIIFCTTGVLLQKLINEMSMKRYSHIILDEVHERDVELDLLLVVIRRLLISKNKYVKIILMSATLNADRFAEYFKFFNKHGKYGKAPILNLEVKKKFDTRIHFLDDLEGAEIGVNRTVIKQETPGVSSAMYKIAIEMIVLLTMKSRPSFPSFLIFLPGIQDIKRFKVELYKPHKHFDISKFHLTILHSSIPTEDYSKAFDGTVENKIILATNIAESSVTLPGVRFVIDFCLTKYQETDTATNMTQLKLAWASKMSLTQRAGRVGRTEAGQVIRLIYKDHFEALPLETKPEIQRVSLESVVIKAKMLNMGKPSDILGVALDPPNRSAIIDSILVLKELGAMESFTKRGKFDANDGKLTFVGAVMGKLPVDVRASKLIILGYVFSCLKECTIIAAGLSSKSLFKLASPSVEHKIEEFDRRLEQAEGSGSDLIATLNAYLTWREALSKGLSGSNEKIWCHRQCFDLKNLRDMHELVEDLERRLLIFRVNQEDDTFDYRNGEKLFVIKMCIAGAFYPNYFEFGGTPPGREQYKNLTNMNPSNCVYMKGAPAKRLTQVYEKQVRENLHNLGVADDVNEMQVNFDNNSSRLVVEFKSITHEESVAVPGEVRPEVYRAVKLRKTQKNMELNMLDQQEEIDYALKMNLGTFVNERFEWKKKILKASKLCIYPKLHHNNISGEITNIVNPGKFYFQPYEGRSNVEKHQTILAKGCKSLDSVEETIEGRRLLVKHESVIKRGKIVDENEDGNFKVFLIDYGKVLDLKLTDFYTCEGLNATERLKSLQLVFDLPPQCFECRLSEVIPSPVLCASGWSKESIEEFKKWILDKKLKIEVNSFVDKVASTRLLTDDEESVANVSVNDRLVNSGYALTSDDSYMNQLDRLERRKQARKIVESEKIEDEFCDVGVIPPPEKKLCHAVKINGPFSPLECQPDMVCREKNHVVRIDSTSVNQVLIDPFPNDASKKVLVAASMSQKDDRVTLHETTIMPHLPGMMSLLGLIFSPTSEVRLSPKKDRYTWILCGLGADTERKAHFGEHDLLINADVDLNQRDFKNINELRYKISKLLRNVSTFKYQLKVNSVNRAQLRHEICSLLLEIFTEYRRPLGIVFPGSTEWNWKPPVKDEERFESVYPQLEPVEKLALVSENTRNINFRRAAELENLAKTNARNESIKCQFCEEDIETLVDLQLHLGKKLHKEQLVRIRDETNY